MKKGFSCPGGLGGHGVGGRFILSGGIGLCLVMWILGAGCKQEQKLSGPIYRTNGTAAHEVVYYFAVNPFHNPVKMGEAYQPLVEELNKTLSGLTLELEASRDMTQFEQKVKSRQPEVIRPNPWQTLLAIQSGYHVVAMEGAAEDFKGLIIVRKDSDIVRPVDLKGRSVSYPSPTSFSACIMPQYFLQMNGVNVMTEIDNHYVGSQESSIMNVYLKLTTAGATWPLSWRAFVKEHPAEAAELKVIWETESLINSSIMVRNDVQDRLQAGLVNFLFQLDRSGKGRTILENIGIDRYRPASDRDYDVVRKYVVEFERIVRKVGD